MRVEFGDAVETDTLVDTFGHWAGWTVTVADEDRAVTGRLLYTDRETVVVHELQEVYGQEVELDVVEFPWESIVTVTVH